MLKLKLDTRAFQKGAKQLTKKLSKYAEYNEKEIRIGVPDEAISFNNGKATRIAEYARYNEFGSFGGDGPLPERPFLRNSLNDEYKQKLIEVARQKGVIVSHRSILNALEAIGKQGVDNVHSSILYGKYEGLSPATIRRKGHSRPLIDSGDLYYSISYTVMNKTR